MSDKIRKSTLSEAKADFKEIQEFAKKEAMKELEGKIDQRLEDIINESIEREEINEDVSIEMMKVKAGEKEIEIDGDGNVTVSGEDESSSEDEEVIVSADEEEVEIDETMDEMINDNISEMNMEEYNMEEQEAQQPAPAAPAAEAPVEAPAEAPAEAPVEEPAAEAPVEDDSAEEKITDGIKELISQMTGTVAGGEGEVEVIDDEAAAAPEAPAAEAPAAPVQEDEDILEIVDEMNAEEGVYEIVDEIDEMIADEGVYEVVDEDDEVVGEEPVEEMHGVGHNLRHSNRLGKHPRQGVNHRSEINENKKEGSKLISEAAIKKELKKIQAHYESKMDGLIKENSRLTSKNEDLSETIESFKESFIELRNQFNEMQNFNAKLAYANKLFADGGFTVEEKKQIAEQFERVDTAEEAQRLFKKIVKESQTGISSNGVEKLKSPKTNTAQPKSQAQPLFESAYTKRLKELAGIEKSEE